MPAAESTNGLSAQEALKRLRTYGRNELPRQRPPSMLSVFLKQFFSPLLVVLLIASGLTYLAHEVLNSVVILGAVLLNAFLGFFQEFRAVRTLHMLSQVLNSEAYVVRDGKTIKVDVTQIVPGDIVILEHGQRIPADGVVVESEELRVSEAILTGESMPVEKQTVKQPPLPQNSFVPFNLHKDLSSCVYMGTTVAGGFGKMLVVQTGQLTAIGSLAKSLTSIKQKQTPLQKKLTKLSLWLTVTIMVIVGVVMVIGMVRGYEFKSLTLIAVALAVSAIPEGLSLVLTNILSVAMSRILKQHGLVRSLVAAETLGSVDVICTDKTGTLTYGELRIVDIIAKADSLPMLYRALAVTADMRDPLEFEMKRWLEKKGKDFAGLRERHPRVAHLGFNLDNRFTATQTARNLFAFGAPEVILRRSNLDAAEQKKIMHELKQFGSKGYRLVAVGGKEKRAVVNLHERDVQKLDWYGFVVFRDQERSDVQVALQRAKAAGAIVKVITGDYSETAKGLLERIGWYVEHENICTGEELEQITSARERRALVERCEIFARVTPQQKLIIVQTLQEAGHVVAMMGDGVNDALALKTADISVVTRKSSDVAKEIADLVLLKNTFSTVVSAIEEGRAIHLQIQKVLLFLLSGSFTEVVLVFASIAYGLPVPLTAVQILWINILTDGPPSFALVFEKKDPQALKKGPTPRNAPLLPFPTAVLAGLVSLLTGTVAFTFYLYYLGSGLQLAQTLVFLLVLIFSLMYIFSVRSLLQPIWSSSIFSNMTLVWTCVGTVVVQAILFYTPVFRELLNLDHIELDHVIVLLVSSVVVVVGVEGIKATIRTLQTHPAEVS